MITARRRTDRHAVLAQLAEGAPLTTLELAEALKLPLRRLAMVIGQLVAEHALDHGPRRADGYAWLISDIGRAELARAETAFTGEPPKRQAPADDGWETIA